MKIGLALPHLGPEATKENILQIAVDAEKEGFDSLFPESIGRFLSHAPVDIILIVLMLE
jgi:hypothetical protein